MNWQEFEDRIKAEAQKQQTPVDPDALWEKIQQKKRRRRLPFFWLLAGVGALVGGLFFIGHFSQRTSSISEKAVLFQQDSLAATTDLSHTDQAVRPLANASTVEQSDNPTDLSAKNISPVADSHKENHPSNPAQSAGAGKAAVAESAHVANKSFRGNYPVETTPYRDAGKSVTPKTPASKPAEVPAVLDMPPVLAPLAALHPIDSPRIESNKTDLSDTASPSAETMADLSSPGFQQPTALPLLLHPFLQLQAPTPNRSVPPVFAPANAATKKTEPVYIGLQAGYGSWNIRRSDSSLNTRSNEKLLAVLQIGIHAQLPIGRSWSIRTGIQYTQFQSVFRWTKTWEVSDTNTPVLNYYVNGTVDTTFMSSVYQYRRKVQHYNRLQSIAIPVDLQYALALRRWSLKPMVGLQVQVWQRGDGVILQGTEPGQEIYRAVYKHAFNLGLRLGLSLEAPIGPKTRLFVEPAAALDLFDRTQSTYPAERFRQWGINLGVLRQW